MHEIVFCKVAPTLVQQHFPLKKLANKEMSLSKMDYTAYVNNLAFLEVLNVLLAMETCA